MAGIRVTSHIGDLASDMRTITRQVPPTLAKVVRKNAIEGNRLAKSFAKASSGTHGKLYPRSFTWEMSRFYGFGAGSVSAIYGPDTARPQGGMSFEFGSRNQAKPHLDLAKSADVIGPALAHEAGKAVDDLFWPGA